MLSINWLIFCWRENDAKQALNAFGTTAINGRTLLKQIAGQQKAYTSNITGAGPQAVATITELVNLASKNEVVLNPIIRDYKSTTEMQNQITHSTGLSRSQDLVLFYFNCKGGAHAVALCNCIQANTCYLFDPNYSMMIIEGGIDSARFRGIINEIHTSYSITCGQAFALYKKTI